MRNRGLKRSEAVLCGIATVPSTKIGCGGLLQALAALKGSEALSPVQNGAKRTAIIRYGVDGVDGVGMCG